jgi:NAD(P)H-flavin reductase
MRMQTPAWPPRPGSRADNPYLPNLARISRIQRLAPDNHLFHLCFTDQALNERWTHLPGQFVELSVIGTGEAPISICSSPTRRGFIELCVRRVGRVTNALHHLARNDLVGIRGPYGNGFPVDQMEGSDLLIVAGGLGMAPLRSLMWYALDNRERFGKLTVMCGARTPGEMLFRDELISLTSVDGLTTLLAVDRDPAGAWQYHVGLLPELFAEAELDARHTYAAVVGPPVVYRFVLQELLARNFAKDRILMSLERRMKCGIGKCGHCSIGYKYTCIHGPVFTYWDAINLPEVV